MVYDTLRYVEWNVLDPYNSLEKIDAYIEQYTVTSATVDYLIDYNEEIIRLYRHYGKEQMIDIMYELLNIKQTIYKKYMAYINSTDYIYRMNSLSRERELHKMISEFRMVEWDETIPYFSLSRIVEYVKTYDVTAHSMNELIAYQIEISKLYMYYSNDPLLSDTLCSVVKNIARLLYHYP